MCFHLCLNIHTRHVTTTNAKCDDICYISVYAKTVYTLKCSYCSSLHFKPIIRRLKRRIEMAEAKGHLLRNYTTWQDVSKDMAATNSSTQDFVLIVPHGDTNSTFSSNKHHAVVSSQSEISSAKFKRQTIKPNPKANLDQNKNDCDCYRDEHICSSGLSNQLALRIRHSPLDVSERENWLENEVQPTDSEIDSIYKDMHENCRVAGENNNGIHRTLSSNTFTTSDCETMEDERQIDSPQSKIDLQQTKQPIYNKLKQNMIDLTEPMSRDELIEAMNTLRCVYTRKYGDLSDLITNQQSPESNKSTPIDSGHSSSITANRRSVERMDCEINDIKLKLIKLSIDQQKLKDVLGISSSSFDKNELLYTASTNNNGDPGTLDKIRRCASTTSSDLRSPSPRDVAMFIPLDQYGDDFEEKLKHKDKLISRQLQRRENLLQRRIQRVTERRYLEDEIRLQEQWIEKTKADHNLKRNLILQSHQQEKTDERLGESNFLSSNSTRINQHLSETSTLSRGRNGNLYIPTSTGVPSLVSNSVLRRVPSEHYSPQIQHKSRFMAPTSASQKRMNRAASLMSGLNQCDLNQSISNLTIIENGSSMHNLMPHQYGSSTNLNRSSIDQKISNLKDDIPRRFSIHDHSNRLADSTISLSSQNGRISRGLASKPQSKTNRHYLINSITHVSLAGQANRKQREAVLLVNLF
ncbi:hypothetical protein GJ496_009004 [Pomphorhynchus laevis]|nr:hypothetical protein GJ496_009004 [Pomphorhynchus laevis]